MRGTAGSYGSPLSNFFEKLHTVPQITKLIYVPTNCAQGFSFPHISLQHLLKYCDNSHSKRYEMIAHCGFDSHFWDGYRLKNSFICLSTIWIASLENVYLCLRFIFQFGCFFDIQVCELLTHLGY